jgi:heme exporter protein C
MRILNPRIFISYLDKYNTFLTIACGVLYIVGLYFALIASPADYQQGEYVRIMYVHVPSAWMSLMLFGIIGLCSIICLVFRIMFAFLIARATAIIGVAFTFITLVTGSLWGKPIWGTWWVWDARLTSMLILFMFYCGYIAIALHKDIYKSSKPACIIGILGCINIPIVKFSVNIWYSLHQPASVFRAGGPAIDGSMLVPLLLIFCASLILFIIIMRLILKTKL